MHFPFSYALGFLALLALPCQALHFSEVVAASPGGGVDEDGAQPDWVEIHNADAAPVSLAGWSLSDDPAKPAKWRFPAVPVPAGGYLVVFCSEKNRAVAGQPLHTNFQLAEGGETLLLTRPEGGREATLSFDAQQPGISFDGADFLFPPTPGASNATSSVAITRAPQFSRAAGFQVAAFDLTLSCATAGSSIRYTLDGSEPLPTSALYSKPLRISKTTAVRAVGFSSGKPASAVATSTYLFVADMVKQSPTGRAPAGWPASWGLNRVDYGVDPRISTTGKFTKVLPAALKAIPTMAITMPLADLFDAETGIYANAQNKGSDWERAASLELIHPDGKPGFQINAGLRIRGGASRTSENPKHSFRVLMRKEYGAGSLNYPLFGTEGAARTERFDLRCEQLIAWHYFVNPEADFIRDIYARSTHGLMGQPYTRSQFYHLVINGQYWGMYQTEERISSEYGEAYFGGQEEDYDVIKVDYDGDSTGGGTTFVDGSFGAWRRAVLVGQQGFEGNANYFRVQGMNEDGTRNAALEPLVDVDNLIDYMLAGIYNAVDDSPPGYGTQNNWSAMRSRKGEFGFRFFAHDWEISMNDGSGTDNRVGEHPTQNPFLGSIGGPIGPWDILPPVDGPQLLSPDQANPYHFWQAMRMNAEFRLRVADHVQKHFFQDGVLTQAHALARWRGFMEVIDQAVIGESARWGDARREGIGLLFQVQQKPLLLAPHVIQLQAGQDLDDALWMPAKAKQAAAPLRLAGPVAGSSVPPVPFTRDDWLKACTDHILNGFLANRTANVLEHLRLGNLLAPVPAPSLSPHGGVLATGDLISLTAAEYVDPDTAQPLPVDLYYTTNGSDPRVVGGLPSSKAILYAAPFSLAKKTTVKVRARDPGGQWSALVEAVFEPSADYAALKITELHYNPPASAGADAAEFIELQNTGTTALNLSGVAFREGVDFTFPAGSSLAAGAYAVVARDVAAFSARHGFSPYGPYTGRLDNDGETLTLHSPSAVRISSLDYDDEGDWPTAPDGFGHSLVLDGKGDADEGKNGSASAALGGSPGRAETSSKQPLPLVLQELSHSAGVVTLKLRNLSSNPVDLSGWKLLRGSNSQALAAGLSIPAQGELALSGADLAGLSFPATGGAVALQCSDLSTLRRDAVHRLRYGPLLPTVTYARVVTSEGREYFPQHGDGALLLPQLRISEIHYLPKPIFHIRGAPPPPEFEFLELENTGSSAVDLSGYRTSGITHVFASGASLPAGGRCIVTSADAVLFRMRYGVPSKVEIFGPTTGTLDDGGERVAVEAPVTVGGAAAWSVVEELRYNDAAPWPVLAAGRGHSLQRLSAQGFSAEPMLWSSAYPSPGERNAVNAAPTVTLTPLPATAGARRLPFRADSTDLDGRVEKLELVVDGSVLEQVQGSQTHTFFYTLSTGVHDLWLRATDDDGAVTLSNTVTLDAAGLPEGAGLGLRAEYFTNTELSGPAQHTETVAELGGDWLHSDPAPGVSRSAFSVRYSGKLLPRVAGQHSIQISCSGGVRLSLAGSVVLDAWGDPGSAVPLVYGLNFDAIAAEPVEVLLEYFDADGAAQLSMTWSEPDVFQQQPVPQALLYSPEQDVNAPAIAVPAALQKRYRGQRFSLNLAVMNAPVSAAEMQWELSAGSLPLGLGLSSAGSISGSAATAGRYAFTVRVGFPDQSFITRQVQMLVLDRGVAAPSITLTSPLPVVRTLRTAPVLLAGTVTGSAVAVRYQLNYGSWHRLPISGKSWSLALDPLLYALNGGDNEVAVQAEDAEGRLSVELRRKFSRQYPSTLTVTIQGAGTVSRGYLGTTQRTVGLRYSVQAMPAPGFIFAGWRGSVSDDTSAALTFTMQEFMSLEAHFVPNPFLGAEGAHWGLLRSADTLRSDARCRLRIQLTSQGSYTGVADYVGLRFLLRGQLSAAGTSQVYATDSRTGRSISATLQYDGRSKRIHATMGLYLNQTEVVLADSLQPAVRHTAHAGLWNMQLPHVAGHAEGHGFMACSVSSTGTVTLVGRMPTGASITDASHLTAAGTVPLYVSLRPFDPGSQESESLSALWQLAPSQAEWLWAATAEGDGVIVLPLRFPPSVQSFAHQMPATTTRWLARSLSQTFVPVETLQVTIKAATLSSPLTGTSPMRGRAQIIPLSEGASALVNLAPWTGRFYAALTLPATTALPRRVVVAQGIANAEASTLRGYFLDTDGSIGSFTATPP